MAWFPIAPNYWIWDDSVVVNQEEERIRIAGELHDGVLQLTSASLLLGAVKRQPDSEAKTAKIGELQKKLMEVGTDIRQISHELHPEVLHESGLPAALSAYCEEFSKTRGIPVSCEADANVRELSPGAALCLYRIAQDALGNVAKHARAKQVRVRLTRSASSGDLSSPGDSKGRAGQEQKTKGALTPAADGVVCLMVTDDGVGFTLDRVGYSGGLGLINMRERVRQLHGSLEVESEPGRGTTVRAEVPFRRAA